MIFVRSFSTTTSANRSTTISSGSLSTSKATNHRSRRDGSNSANITVLRTIDIRSEGLSPAYELDFTSVARMDEKGDFETSSGRSEYVGRGEVV